MSESMYSTNVETVKTVTGFALGAQLAMGAVQLSVDFAVAKRGGEDSQTSPEPEPIYFSPLAGEQLAVCDEVVSTALAGGRIERAMLLLYTAEAGHEAAIDEVVRERALGRLANIGSSFALLDPDYRLSDPVFSFGGLNVLYESHAMRVEGQAFSGNRDALRTHHDEVRAATKLAAEAYAFAALEQ